MSNNKMDTNNLDEMMKNYLEETYGEGFANIGNMMQDVLKSALGNLEEEIDIEQIKESVPGVDTKTILENAKKAKEEALSRGSDAIDAQAKAMQDALNEQFFGGDPNNGVNYEELMAKQMEMINNMMNGTSGYSMPNMSDFNEAIFGPFSFDKLYELINEMYREIPSGNTITISSDDPYIRHFEVLLSGILTYINGHESDQLAVEEDDDFFKEKVNYILSDIWGINSKEDTLDTIAWLLNSGHSDEYLDYIDASSYLECIDDDSDEEDIMIAKNGYEFAQYFKDKLPDNIILGWDYGRASMITRWSYYLGYLSEDEAWEILDTIASYMIETFHSWKEYGISYIIGGLFWTYRTNPDGVYERYQDTVGALEGLLTTEDEDDGDWFYNPWIIDVD